MDFGTGAFIGPTLQAPRQIKFVDQFKKTALTIHKLFEQTLKAKVCNIFQAHFLFDCQTCCLLFVFILLLGTDGFTAIRLGRTMVWQESSGLARGLCTVSVTIAITNDNDTKCCTVESQWYKSGSKRSVLLGDRVSSRGASPLITFLLDTLPKDNQIFYPFF